MSMITGVDGSATIPAGAGGTTITIFRWNADIQREVFDATGFGADSNRRVKIGGMYHLVGTAEGWLDTDGVPVLGSLITSNAAVTAGFVLQSQSTDTYTFSGIVGNINVVVERVGQAIATISFESSGAVTPA